MLADAYCAHGPVTSTFAARCSTASWPRAARSTTAGSATSPSTSRHGRPEGRRCSTVTSSPRASSPVAAARPSIPLAPVTRTFTAGTPARLPAAARPAGRPRRGPPSTGAGRRPAGAARPARRRRRHRRPPGRRQPGPGRPAPAGRRGPQARSDASGARSAARSPALSPDVASAKVDHHDRHHLRAGRADADDRGGRHPGQALHPLLDPDGRHGTGGGGDDVLQASLDPEPAVGVQVPDVAGPVPTRDCARW